MVGFEFNQVKFTANLCLDYHEAYNQITPAPGPDSVRFFCFISNISLTSPPNITR